MGPYHAGVGKTYLSDHHAFEEIASVVTAAKQYCTCEDFIDYEYDLRIQYGKYMSQTRNGLCSILDMSNIDTLRSLNSSK